MGMGGLGGFGEEWVDVWEVARCRGGWGLVDVEYDWGVILSSS